MNRICLMEGCGNLILGRPNKVFCSDTCSTRERAKRMRDRAAEARMERLAAADCLDIHCGECRQKFTPDWRELGPKKYCSVACRDTARRRKVRANKDARKAQGHKRSGPQRAAPIDLGDTPPPASTSAATGRLCSNCANWTGSRGCALESFRACNPGVMSRHWRGVQREGAAS